MRETRATLPVMAGLDPAIHVSTYIDVKAWMPVTSTGMTSVSGLPPIVQFVMAGLDPAIHVREDVVRWVAALELL